MNLFQLVFKQMRQRALGTWLTLLSVLLGVALATAVMLVRRGSERVFGQTEYGYDVLVGPKGSKLQLVLNTVYQIDVSPGNIPYAAYEALANPRNPQVRIAVPFAVGDSYRGRRVVGTLPKLFGVGDDGQPLPPEKTIEYRPGRRYELAEGRVFHPMKFEAVIGSDVAKALGLGIGGTFKASHGLPESGQQEHVHDQGWTIVGVLKPTQTAHDNVLFIPLMSFYAIAEHEEGLEAHQKMREAAAAVAPGGPGRPPAAPEPAKEAEKKPSTPAPADDSGDLLRDVPDAHDHDDHEHKKGGDATSPDASGGSGGSSPAVAAAPAAAAAGATTSPTASRAATEGDAHEDHDHHDHPEGFHLEPDGTIHLDLPKAAWEVSAVLVKARGAFPAQTLMYGINNSPIAMAVNPASVMRDFFETFLRGSTLLLLGLSALVTVVAAVSILVSIYNAVAARMREIAILRALGATRARILTQICVEAGLIGLIGGILGLVAGHLVAGVISFYFRRTLGEGIDWLAPAPEEVIYLGGVVLIAVLAGLVPALKAYRTPVATNLVAG